MSRSKAVRQFPKSILCALILISNYYFELVRVNFPKSGFQTQSIRCIDRILVFFFYFSHGFDWAEVNVFNVALKLMARNDMENTKSNFISNGVFFCSHQEHIWFFGWIDKTTVSQPDRYFPGGFSNEFFSQNMQRFRNCVWQPSYVIWSVFIANVFICFERMLIVLLPNKVSVNFIFLFLFRWISWYYFVELVNTDEHLMKFDRTMYFKLVL